MTAPPNIDNFLLCLKEYNFLEVFSKYETYLWSNFPFNPTSDIDIMFIGKPTEDLGEKIKDFKDYAAKYFNLKIDEQVFIDTKVFAHIEEYNRTGNMNLRKITKYKLTEQASPRIYQEKPSKINKYFWEFKLLDANEKYKFRVGKLNLHYPIDIQDFINLVWNIRNSDLYNTYNDPRKEEFRTLRKDFKKSIQC